MTITAVVELDLSPLVGRFGIDTLSPEARDIWCRMSPPTQLPTHVRINVGEADSVDWPPHFVRDLAQIPNVQIVGAYPWTVDKIAADLMARIDRVQAA